MKKIIFSNRAEKNFDKLSLPIKNKFIKQIKLIEKDLYYPSLRVKKLKGTEYFEARIDYHYRFIFRIKNEDLFIIAIGPHDEGLGKK